MSKRFESFEKTISILESIKNKLPVDCYDYAVANVEWARAKRLLADEREALKDVWKPVVKPKLDLQP